MASRNKLNRYDQSQLVGTRVRPLATGETVLAMIGDSKERANAPMTVR